MRRPEEKKILVWSSMEWVSVPEAASDSSSESDILSNFWNSVRIPSDHRCFSIGAAGIVETGPAVPDPNPAEGWTSPNRFHSE